MCPQKWQVLVEGMAGDMRGRKSDALTGASTRTIRDCQEHVSVAGLVERAPAGEVLPGEVVADEGLVKGGPKLDHTAALWSSFGPPFSLLANVG